MSFSPVHPYCHHLSLSFGVFFIPQPLTVGCLCCSPWCSPWCVNSCPTPSRGLIWKLFLCNHKNSAPSLCSRLRQVTERNDLVRLGLEVLDPAGRGWSCCGAHICGVLSDWEKQGLYCRNCCLSLPKNPWWAGMGFLGPWNSMESAGGGSGRGCSFWSISRCKGSRGREGENVRIHCKALLESQLRARDGACRLCSPEHCRQQKKLQNKVPDEL